MSALDEAMAGLAAVFSRSRRKRRKVWLLLDVDLFVPVQRADGSVEFELDAAHAAEKAWLDEALGPKWWEDDADVEL